MLFTAKYVIPVTSSHIEDGAVLVRDDKIEDLGPAEFLKAKYPEEEVRDFGRSALMPGFVDVHTHLGYTVLRGLFDDLPYAEWKREVLRREPLFTSDDWTTSARLGALEAVASGVTTIADITTSKGSVEAADEIGLRARIYNEILTTRKEHVDDVVEKGTAQIERWRGEYTSGRLSFGMAPGPIYACHPLLLKKLAAYANETNTPLAMHLAGSNEEADFIRYGSSPFAVHTSEYEHHLLSKAFPPWLPAGVSPVQYVVNWDILDVPEMLAVHCVHVDDADIEILKNKDVAVAYCPRINAKLSMGFAPLLKFLRAGLRVGIGTDSPAAVDTIDVIDEIKTGLMITRATSPSRNIRLESARMLRMATIDAARALRMDDQIGSLEPGKKADMIAVDLHNSHQNPTSNPESAVIYTANQDNVMMTMVDGKILYDNFVHVSGVDRDGIVSDARELRTRISRRVDDAELIEELKRRVDEDRRDRFDR